MDIKAQVIAKHFIDCLLEGQVMDLLIPRNELDSFDEECDDGDSEESTAVTRTLFQVETAKSYAQTMAAIALQAELVSSGRTISLRDVYYSLKHLFSKQSESNSIVLDVGRLCELKRHEMGVIASAKGYASGKFEFKFHRSDHPDPSSVSWTSAEDPITDRRVMISYQWMSSVLYSSDNDASDVSGVDDMPGTDTHPVRDVLHIRCANQDVRPCFIVVVEKEGVFHRLVEDRLTSVIPCILVTGCGFPDIATRALVKKLVDYFQNIEVVGLCDYNPQGLALLLTYRMSSVSSSFEARGLQVPLRWLGLRQCHIAALRRKGRGGCTGVLVEEEKECEVGERVDGGEDTQPELSHHLLQALSANDINKLQSMIRKQSVPPEYVEEVECMLQGGVKCELEALYSLGLDFISTFVEDSLRREVQYRSKTSSCEFDFSFDSPN